MEDDKKKFESVFGVSNARNTAPLEATGSEELASPHEPLRKTLSTGASLPNPNEDNQSRAPPTPQLIQAAPLVEALKPAPVKIKEAKIQG